MTRKVLPLLILLAFAPALMATECDGNQHHRLTTDPGPVAPIPEPTAALLFGTGLAVLAYRQRKGK